MAQAIVFLPLLGFLIAGIASLLVHKAASRAAMCWPSAMPIIPRMPAMRSCA